MAPILTKERSMNRDDVINKDFPHSLFGYDPIAVDAFLDEVIREFDRMTNTIDVLQFKLAQELGSARMTNDILTARLEKTGFEQRAEQLLPSGIPTPAEPEQEPEDKTAPPAETPAADDEPAVPADSAPEDEPRAHKHKRKNKHE